MKQIIKRTLYKIISVLMKPVLDEHAQKLAEKQRVDSRQLQILLSFKYREAVLDRNEHLDFDQVSFNVWSSTHEDGILLYIFSIIGMTNKKLCVDIGSGPIQGSNTANLIINHGFRGLLIDGNPGNVEIARNYYAAHSETWYSPPICVAEFVTAENINGILRGNGFTGTVDLLCIDIDGMDYWIWKAISAIDPRVVLVEYNDCLGPERAWTVPYKSDFNVHDYEVNRQRYNYHGASLGAFVNLGRQKGYKLVGCSKGGWNAFFVKTDVDERRLPEVTAESCFRYEWNRFSMEERFPLVKDMSWQEV